MSLTVWLPVRLRLTHWSSAQFDAVCADKKRLEQRVAELEAQLIRRQAAPPPSNLDGPRTIESVEPTTVKPFQLSSDARARARAEAKKSREEEERRLQRELAKLRSTEGMRQLVQPVRGAGLRASNERVSDNEGAASKPASQLASP